ncbi:hypothetical protein GCM10010964_39290 [Caldovatus sediminis]|uniref:Transposase n=1 Tax=Caldovatus sediminis TaxID=2041189 RepID=A0A8J2ZED5_9PROT|nr:hypothetical protein GCM10010964_39290 [Caldovatus sediminis]
MWMGADRGRHRRASDQHPSGLTDAEWPGLERLILPAKPGGRPRATDMRAAADALFCLRALAQAGPAQRRIVPAWTATACVRQSAAAAHGGGSGPTGAGTASPDAAPRGIAARSPPGGRPSRRAGRRQTGAGGRRRAVGPRRHPR